MSGSVIGTPAVGGDALFTVAEARAHDNAQLASVTDFTSAAIIAKEIEIRSLFIAACGVDFFPTTHTDEYQDGNGTESVLLKWPLLTEITSASIRTNTTWTALTAGELAALQAFDTSEVYFDCHYWPTGRRNVKVTYVAGHPSVPPLIKDAALDIAVYELPPSNVPWQADSYDAGGTSYSWARGDGYGGNWSALPSVMRALRLYDRSLVGIG